MVVLFIDDKKVNIYVPYQCMHDKKQLSLDKQDKD